MIPFAPFSLPQLLLLLAPFLALALSAGLLLRGLYGWLRARKQTAAQRPRWWTPTFTVLVVLALAGDAWGLVLLHQFHKIHAQVELRNHYRHSRSNFVLPENFQYGTLLVPQGSLINRYDAFDNGEAQRPLGLRGLKAVRFAHPVLLGRMWAAALGDGISTVELARDQRVGPVYHFDPTMADGYGAWVPDPRRPSLECKQGDLVQLHVPLVEYDIQAEFTRGEPDGADARFDPGQWGVTDCHSGQPPLDVLPPYAATPPPGAHTPVWGPLIPNTDD